MTSESRLSKRLQRVCVREVERKLDELWPMHDRWLADLHMIGLDANKPTVHLDLKLARAISELSTVLTLIIEFIKECPTND